MKRSLAVLATVLGATALSSACWAEDDMMKKADPMPPAAAPMASASKAAR